LVKSGKAGKLAAWSSLHPTRHPGGCRVLRFDDDAGVGLRRSLSPSLDIHHYVVTSLRIYYLHAMNGLELL